MSHVRSVTDADQAIIRNIDIVSSVEQALLGSSRILIAGCGSVGGSAVEPLVRLGVGSLFLADPDVYDLTNINRQACFLSDIGQSKVGTLATRAKWINPDIEVECFKEGLTKSNIEMAMENVTVVFDGIDAGEAPMMKYRLHEIAVKKKIPVMSGVDYGGKAVIYVFDYRAKNVLPFYGKMTQKDYESGDLSDCTKWLGYFSYSSDFLPIIADRLQHKTPWPQVSYCVMAMGALASRTIVDLLMKRKVPHIVSFDVHMASRTWAERAKKRLVYPIRLAHTFVASKKVKKAFAKVDIQSDVSTLDAYLHENPELSRVLQCMVRTPSPHNCQPWQFVITSPNTIRIELNPARFLYVIDPEAQAMDITIGCVIESAAAVADIEYIAPETEAPLVFGTIKINRLNKENYSRNRDLLAYRHTNRNAFMPLSFSQEDISEYSSLAEHYGTKLSFLQDKPNRISKLARKQALRMFRMKGYLIELMSHFRLTSSELQQNPTGFCRNSVKISWVESKVLAVLKQWPLFLSISRYFGLSEIMAVSAVKTVNQHSNFILFSSNNWTRDGRINMGRSIMKVWLQLAKKGVSCQPVDFPISTEQGREQVKQEFGSDDNYRPVFLLRVGLGIKANNYVSARLPLENVCELNVDAS